MRRNHSFVLLVAVIGLCFYYQYTKPTMTVEEPTIQRYTIVKIKPPLHFNVSLKNENGEIFNDIYVSKFCNHWEDVRVGDLIQLKTVITKIGIENQIKTEIDAYKVCPDNK